MIARFFIAFLVTCLPGSGDQFDDWLASRRVMLEELRDAPIEEKLEHLPHVLGGLVNRRDHSPEADKLYLDTQELLVSTPGHAEYYGRKIREWEQQALNNPEPAYSDYLRNRMNAFGTLQQLPSVETARVMAGFLDEERQVMEGNSGRFYDRGPMWGARSVLRSIIADPPSAEPTFQEWRNWRDEIESGGGSFRLKGSDLRYNFKGPVTQRTRPPRDDWAPPDGEGPQSVSDTGGASASRGGWDTAVGWYAILSSSFLFFASLGYAVWRRWKA